VAWVHHDRERGRYIWERNQIRELPTADFEYVRSQFKAATALYRANFDADLVASERTPLAIPRSDFKPGGISERALRTLDVDRRGVHQRQQEQDRADLAERDRAAYAKAEMAKHVGDADGLKEALATIRGLRRRAYMIDHEVPSGRLRHGYGVDPQAMIDKNKRQFAESGRAAKLSAVALETGRLPVLATTYQYVARLTDWDYINSVAYSTRQLDVHLHGKPYTVDAPELIVFVRAVVRRCKLRGIPMFGRSIDIAARTVSIDHCKWSGILTDHEYSMLAELVTATAGALGLRVSWPGQSNWIVSEVEDPELFRPLLQRNALRAWVKAVEGEADG